MVTAVQIQNIAGCQIEDTQQEWAQWTMEGLKGTPLFLEIGSFYNSPRVKQMSFTVFESI